MKYIVSLLATLFLCSCGIRDGELGQDGMLPIVDRMRQTWLASADKQVHGVVADDQDADARVRVLIEAVSNSSEIESNELVAAISNCKASNAAMSDLFLMDLYLAVLTTRLDAEDHSSSVLLLSNVPTDVIGNDPLEVFVLWHPMDGLKPKNTAVHQLEMLFEAYERASCTRSRLALSRSLRRAFMAAPVPHRLDEVEYIKWCRSWMRAERYSLELNPEYDRLVSLDLDTAPGVPLLKPNK